MDNDRVWMYAAMIVIYFIAWVLKRIKGVAGDDQGGKPTPKKRTVAEMLEEQQRDLQRQAEQPGKSQQPPSVLRRLFESIADETKNQRQDESFLPESEPAPSQAPPFKKTPPPLSPGKAKPSSVAERLSPTEQRALAKLKLEASQAIEPQGKFRLHSLRSMTRGQGLRQAVVLKEILDQPRALRPY